MLSSRSNNTFRMSNTRMGYITDDLGILDTRLKVHVCSQIQVHHNSNQQIEKKMARNNNVLSSSQLDAFAPHMEGVSISCAKRFGRATAKKTLQVMKVLFSVHKFCSY